MHRCQMIVVLFALCVSAASQTQGERPHFSHIGPPAWTTFPVDVTDANVPADLVPAVTRAMSAGIDRQRLLALSFKGASENGRTFVLFWGTRGGDNFPHSTGYRLSTVPQSTQTLRVAVCNSLPPPGETLDVRSFYSLRQTIQCFARLVDVRTVTVIMTLSETPLPGTVPPPTGWHGLSTSQTLTFHNGETLLFSDTTRADGTHHLIFVTAYIVLPFRSAS